MTATDAQVRIITREREKGRTQERAAASANVSSRKTVAKYERLGRLPALKQAHHRRGPPLPKTRGPLSAKTSGPAWVKTHGPVSSER